MKNIKIFNYSNDKFLTKLTSIEAYSCFQPEVPDEDFDYLDLPALIAQKFDLIEITYRDYELFRPHIGAIDWKTNVMGSADALILSGEHYKPINIFSMTLLETIKKNHLRINSQQPAIVVGDMHFIVNVVTQLALNGFIKIIYSLTDHQEIYVQSIEKKLKSFIFNIDLSFVHINELTTSQILGSLFISDFKKNVNKEAYELLAYFNFLFQGALFIDCNSIQDGSLIEDARKAEIAVVEETALIEQKYLLLKEIFKI